MINTSKLSLKDFENRTKENIHERAGRFYDYYLQNKEQQHSNYRIKMWQWCRNSID
ncbi:MAG: hypothetical protein ACK5L5_05555 [Bacteroidales bacterium]